MAKDAHTGAGKVRAPAGLSGASSKGSGTEKDAGAKAAPVTPQPAPHLNFSKFWKKGGSPFERTQTLIKPAHAASEDSATTAVAPVAPLSWATANRPITVGVVISG